ncbi:MAG: hypothetical protein HKO07_02510, partial [Pseudomonadales bacterium]|nr:hypothetical protein [Pseudomonadales bacterium]
MRVRLVLVGLALVLGVSLALNLYWWRSHREPTLESVSELRGQRLQESDQRLVTQRQAAPALAISSVDLQLLFDGGDFSDALAG